MEHFSRADIPGNLLEISVLLDVNSYIICRGSRFDAVVGSDHSDFLGWDMEVDPGPSAKLKLI